MNETQIGFGCTECGGKEAGKAGRIPVSRVIDKLDSFFAKNDMPGAGRHLEYWHGEAAALGDLSGELSVVNEELGYYRKVGNAEKGLSAVERSLELLSLLHTDESVSGATVLLNAATTMKAFGKPLEALPLYDRAYAVYAAQLPENDTRFGGFFNNKALTLVDLARYGEAEECYRRALAVMERADSASPDIAVTYVNMAHLYDAWLTDAEAAEKTAECLENAERILEAEGAKRDSYYAYVCTKCAPSYDYFGYFAYAAELQERAKTIYARA